MLLNALTFIHVGLKPGRDRRGFCRCPQAPGVEPALSRCDTLPGQQGCNQRDGLLFSISQFLARAGHWYFVVDPYADSRFRRLSP
jgi:hypothetical protein